MAEHYVTRKALRPGLHRLLKLVEDGDTIIITAFRNHRPVAKIVKVEEPPPSKEKP